MSLHAQPLEPLPELTRWIAEASFPKGTLAMHLRDALGPIYEDADFAHLFPKRGRAAEAPFPTWSLSPLLIVALITSARQAIWGANAEKWSGPGPQCSKLTPPKGGELLPDPATAILVGN